MTHPPHPSEPTPVRAAAALRRPALELVAVSFVVLAQELALIRWLPGQVRVLAYFPNLVLLSAFLGLGVGCLLAAGRPLRWLWPASLAALAGAAALLARVAFTQESASEHLWLLYFDLPEGAPVVDGVRLPILLLFVLSAASFVPLGQLIAERLEVFRRRSSALWGYTWDLTGSLLGVVGFALLSVLGTFPVVWFAVVLAAGGVFFFPSRRGRWLYLLVALAVLAVVGGAEKARIYSPYYAIGYELRGRDLAVTTNGSLHQVGLPLGRAEPAPSAYHAAVREGYHLPYGMLPRPPRRVLVLGAGTGNDVAVLLDQGVERIDAVEIDPQILRLGREHHPDRPYDSPRVTLHNTDARSFLNESEESWDLVVFGTLDSMTRLSALSNVRLDNFVYTREALEAARDHLAPGGGMVLYFMVAADYIDGHLARLLSEVFGEPPAVLAGPYRLFNRIYLAGPAFAAVQAEERAAAAAVSAAPGSDLPTDDWPYLYLVGRGVSGFYLSLMAAIGALAAAAVAAASGRLRRSLLGRGGADLEMFLYGLAFLLLESKFVTEMNLVWGATWITSAVVFGSILAVILLATLTMELAPLPWAVAATGLAATLAANYLVPAETLVGRGLVVRLALSFLFVGAPVFFAGACFALRFRARAAADVALGWNLLGAVAGGLLEFSSMALGLEALSLVALLAYLLSFWIRERQRGAQEESPPQSPL